MISYKEYMENYKKSNMKINNRVLIKTHFPIAFINTSNNQNDKNFLDNDAWILGLLIFLNAAEGDNSDFKSTKPFDYTADAKQLLKQLGKPYDVASIIKTTNHLETLSKHGAIENLTNKTGEKSQNGLDIYKLLPTYDIDASYMQYIELENMMVYFMLDTLNVTEIRILLRSIAIDKSIQLDLINTHQIEEEYNISSMEFKTICDKMVKYRYWIPSYDLRGNFNGYDCKIYETLEGTVAKVKKKEL